MDKPLLPSFLFERDLLEKEIPKLIKFDLLTEYKRNDDTPLDHRARDPISKREFQEAFQNHHLLRGIFKKEKLIAFSWLEPKPESKEMYVYAILVHPDFRDQGIGKYCLKMADYEARSRGFDKCTLTVDPLNGRGVYSYLKHGYQIRDYFLHKWGKNAHRLFMMKDLTVDKIKYTEETRIIECGDDQGILQALEDRFVGVELIRSPDNNNYKNKIVFRKR